MRALRCAPCSCSSKRPTSFRRRGMTVAAAIGGVAKDAPTPPVSARRRRVRIRPFDASRSDAEAVAQMCRDVYGGTDYMPRVIGHLGELAAKAQGEDEQHRTIVLIADDLQQAEEEQEQEEGEEGEGEGAAAAAAAAKERPQAARPHQQQQVGVVVAQLRGEGHAFLFGLRVDPRARGRGVGRALMRAACAAASATGADEEDREGEGRNGGGGGGSRVRGGAEHLVGATIPSNDASIALFLGTGHREHRRVDVWPPFPLLADYEQRVGFAPPPGRQPREEEEQGLGPRYGAGASSSSSSSSSPSSSPDVRLLDHLPGVRDVLLGAAAEAAVEPRRCSCVDELSRALAEVRAAAAARGGEGGGGGGEEEGRRDSPPPPQWVPAMYEVMPARGPWARERAREGGAWLLPCPKPRPSADEGAGAGAGTAVEAVVVVGPSLEARRFVAGVVAVDGDAAARALLLAERLAPGGHFLAFVDAPTTRTRRRGGLEAEAAAGGEAAADDGGAARCALSRLYARTVVPDTHPEGKGCMIVYHRPARAAAADP